MKKSQLRGILWLLFTCMSGLVHAQREIYEICVYTLKSDSQTEATENYLKNTYMPVMHRLGIKTVGVFKPVDNDTSALKRIFVIVPYISLDVWKRTKTNILSDEIYKSDSKSFTETDTAHLPYLRKASTLLEAFTDQPHLTASALKADSGTIYELRSYESPTEKLHTLKVNMFNEGGEIILFKRLGFQAVFYADVLSGSRMPNLMYMISFANAAERDAHWKAFGNSPEWKKISTDPKYQNNISVSHIDSIRMHRTHYSDL